MTRILFAVWPLTGHLHPLLEIARELRTRDYNVGIYSGTGASEAAAAEGFRFFPFVSIDESPLNQILLSDERSVRWKNPFRLMRFFRHWLLDTMPHQITDLEAILRQWSPNLIVADESMWAPTLVIREKHRVAVIPVSVLTGCLLPGPEAPLPMLGCGPARNRLGRLMHRIAEAAVDFGAADLRRSINAIRRRHNLCVLHGSARSAIAQAPAYLVRGSPEFDYHRGDLPPSVHYIGPLEWRGEPSSEQAQWVGDLPPEKAVVFVSEGTMHVRTPALLRAAARGLAKLDLQIVMATGHRNPQSLRLGPLAPNIRVERWVPQKLLLQRTKLVITVGGSGTVFGALSAGVPLIVVPSESDQPDNARRVLEVGAGMVLPRWRCTPRGLRNAVNQVLSDPQFSRNARRMAALFSQYGGASHAANLIEEVLARQRRGVNCEAEKCGNPHNIFAKPAEIA